MVARNQPKYAIRSIVSGRYYKGVWTHEVDGELVLETYPLDFVGVADRQEYRRGEWVDDGTEIVAVMLTDGTFDVVAEGESFHGIVPAGATWEECIDLVPPDRQRRLIEPDEAPVLQASE